eukprot:TRINITY_DN105657_c0_g1_i1.p1 TRINITY_DN105657_c0_g1~~TRINITY_DN105657_c0_g1_i1.p1  ORF type:complete len:655 (-),score=98.66 TRINITY_DN105657_c0_g1_i1:230-2194(-)
MVQGSTEAAGQSAIGLHDGATILTQGPKSWTIPERPSPYSICILNEWCHAPAPQNIAVLHWEFSCSNPDVSNCSPPCKIPSAAAAVGVSRKADTVDDPPSSASSVNNKSALNQLLHKILRRPVGPREVIYDVVGDTPCFTATALVTPAVRGQEDDSSYGPRRFTGQEMPTKKEAEQSAAEVAVNELRESRPLLCAPTYQPVRICETGDDAPSSADPRIDAKSLLNQLIRKVLRRPVAPNEVIYDVIGDASCFTATALVTPAIRGGDGSSYRPRRFTGREMPTKKEAEQSAAEAAIDELRNIEPLPCAPAQQPVICESDDPTKASSQSACSDSENHKGLLCTLLQKQLGRPLAAGDMIWTHQEEQGCFIAIVEVASLALGRVSGAPCSTKKAAQQSAAKVALQQISSVTAGSFPTPLPQAADQTALTLPKAGASAAPSPPDRGNCKPSTRFTCKGWITCGETVVVASAVSESCSSKQAAKEDAAWQLCIALQKGRLHANEHSHIGIATDKANKGCKKPGTLTKREKLALGPGWHGELREICPAAGQHCAKLRLKLGWSQKDLAAHLNQPMDVVQQLEADGLMPSGAVISALNRLLGVPLPRAAHVCTATDAPAYDKGVRPVRMAQTQPKEPILEDFFPVDWVEKSDDRENSQVLR